MGNLVLKSLFLGIFFCLTTLAGADSARNVNVVQPFVYFSTPYYQPGYRPIYPSNSYRGYYNPYYNPSFASPYLQSQTYRSYRDSPSASPDFYMYYRNQMNSNSPTPR